MTKKRQEIKARSPTYIRNPKNQMSLSVLNLGPSHNSRINLKQIRKSQAGTTTSKIKPRKYVSQLRDSS